MQYSSAPCHGMFDSIARCRPFTIVIDIIIDCASRRMTIIISRNTNAAKRIRNICSHQYWKLQVHICQILQIARLELRLDFQDFSGVQFLQGPADGTFHFVPDSTFARHFDAFALHKGRYCYQNHHIVQRFCIGGIGAYFKAYTADVVGNLHATLYQLKRARKDQHGENGYLILCS